MKSKHSVILAGILTLVSFSLYNTILAWVLLLVVWGAVIRAAIYFNYYKHLPSVRTLNLLAVLSILGLIYSALNSGLLFGMINLLALACALKLMQIRNRKDVYQLVVSLFFLIGCGSIFNQSMGFSLFYIVMSLTMLLSLACFHGPSLSLKKQLTKVSILSLQALPIGLLLFLVMPQLPPLWHTPKSKNADTGLSEKISPGDIASLSQSSDLAFRATFESNVPDTRDLYWRAIVMEDFDGQTWQVHPYRKKTTDLQTKVRQEFQPKLSGPSFEYEVIAEATFQSWLFGLDLAVPAGTKSNNDIQQTDNFELVSGQQLVSNYRYSVSSYPEALGKQHFTSIDRQLNLALPKKGNQRTRDWVESLRKSYAQDDAFLFNLLSYFTNQSFTYTLRPTLMPIDSVDRFLFDYQAGFCSHYASALTYALRLGGIPARIVTGYQGGELIINDDGLAYISVYQYDAHAWVEMWRENTGWQRIDPTALVSPDRIEYGLQYAMQDEGSFLADSPFALARLNNIAWLNSIRLFLGNMDYNWSRWVLGFNDQTQANMLKTILGKLTPERLSLLGLSIVSVIALLLALFFLPYWLQKRGNQTQRYYLGAIKALEKTGVKRKKWQGPTGFNQQISENYSDNISQLFTTITKLYLRLTYQDNLQPTESMLTTKQCHKMMRKNLKKLKAELIKHS